MPPDGQRPTRRYHRAHDAPSTTRPPESLRHASNTRDSARRFLGANVRYVKTGLPTLPVGTKVHCAIEVAPGTVCAAAGNKQIGRGAQL